MFISQLLTDKRAYVELTLTPYAQFLMPCYMKESFFKSETTQPCTFLVSQTIRSSTIDRNILNQV